MGHNIKQSHKSAIYGSQRFQRYITYAGVYSSSRETAWTKMCDEEEAEEEEEHEFLGVFDVFLQ